MLELGFMPVVTTMGLPIQDGGEAKEEGKENEYWSLTSVHC